MDKNVEYAVGKVKEYYMDFFKRVDGTEDVEFRVEEDEAEGWGYLYMRAKLSKKWRVRKFESDVYRVNWKELVNIHGMNKIDAERPFYKETNIITGYFAGICKGVLKLDRSDNKSTVEAKVFYWSLDPKAEKEKRARKEEFDRKVWDGNGIVENITDICEVDRSDFEKIDSKLFAEYQKWVEAGKALAEKIGAATDEFEAKGWQ